jgi:predicted fused transcriptional regulator/phosphomethylpyrimidine kinase
LCDRREIQALEGGEHAELKLNVVLGRGDEGSEVVVRVFRDFDLEVLCQLVNTIVTMVDTNLRRRS